MFQSSHAARDHDNGLYVEHDYRAEAREAHARRRTALRRHFPSAFTIEARVESSGLTITTRARQPTGRCWPAPAVIPTATTTSGRCINGNRRRGRTPRDAISFGGPGSVIGANIPGTKPWNHPGAFQMRYVRRLFESLPFTRLAPDQSIILNGPTTGGAKIRAARASDGSFAIIYSPRGESFTLDKSVIKAERQNQYWYDPRYGASYLFQRARQLGHPDVHAADQRGVEMTGFSC